MCLCIESILKIRKPLKALLDEGVFDSKFVEKIPTEKQFDTMAEILKPLSLIKTTMDKLQADNQPTLHLVIPSLVNIGRMTKNPNFK